MSWIRAFLLTAICTLLFSSAICLGAEAATELASADPKQWETFLRAVGGARGLGFMGTIVLVIQILLYLLKSPFGYLAGPYKLLLVTALSLFLGVTGLKIEGFDWQSALLHASTLASFQVFLNQLWKHLVAALKEKE